MNVSDRLFVSLVDDAGLFPPTSLAMSDALARHAADTEAGGPVLTHRFLCPTSRLDELRRHDPGPLRLGLIVDTAAEPDLRGLTVELIETRLPPATVPSQRPRPDTGATVVEPGVIVPAARLAPWAPPSARVFVEVSRGAHFMRVAPGVGLEIHCGGLHPDDFPTPHRLGLFIKHCVRDGVPFRAGAGLHHAVRHHDPSFGVYRHGFLNLILAVCAAVEDHDPVRVLELGEPDELVRLARAVPADVARRARELFVSYGSCITATPRDDLTELGLIDAAPKAGAGKEPM